MKWGTNEFFYTTNYWFAFLVSLYPFLGLIVSLKVTHNTIGFWGLNNVLD